METVSLQNYWPYDEVKAEGDCSSGLFKFSTPWLSLEVQVAEQDISRVSPLVAKLTDETLSPIDLAEVTWLFSSLKQHPLTYLLPRAQVKSNLDRHAILDARTCDSASTPHQVLHELLLEADTQAFERLTTLTDSPSDIPLEWKWDTAAALAFSQCPIGHDPLSLLSIARRFHLLESVENNRTGELYAFLRGLDPNSRQLKDALVRIVRQNYYVTQKCDSALRPALGLAQNAQSEVQKFIRSEAGHDVLLARALKSMGIADPARVPVLDAVVVLMEVFRITAERNFLGFCMIVDIFERSTDPVQDPLAALLTQGGFTKAAHQINLHREINDQGEHENVALHFLDTMAPVDSEYAIEALRLAELATFLTHLVSSALFRECMV